MAAAAGEYDGALPEPVTREDQYWQKVIRKIENGNATPEENDAAIEDYLNMHDTAPQYRHTFVDDDAESAYQSDLYIF